MSPTDKPPSPRADDPGALVVEAQTKHRRHSHMQPPECSRCLATWPCLTARLADALAEALDDYADLRNGSIVWQTELRSQRDAARTEAAALRPVVEAARDWEAIYRGRAVPNKTLSEVVKHLADVVAAIALPEPRRE